MATEGQGREGGTGSTIQEGASTLIPTRTTEAKHFPHWDPINPDSLTGS